MKKINWTLVAIAMACCALGAFIGWLTIPDPTPTEVVKYVEVIQEQKFDTSIVESNWCNGADEGTIRMLGAWWYADGVVEDEQGQLWGVTQDITENDWLMLWIADNHTPNDTRDDIIVKVWREAY